MNKNKFFTIDFTSSLKTAVASRFIFVSTIVLLILVGFFIAYLVIIGENIDERFVPFIIAYCTSFALYPLFIFFIRKGRAQKSIIFLWLIYNVCFLGFFVFVQRGAFTFLEIGYAIFIFISGFLLEGRDITIYSFICCAGYLSPVILARFLSPELDFLFLQQQYEANSAWFIFVSFINSFFILGIGFIVRCIMSKFRVWNDHLTRNRDQLIRAQKIARLGNWEYDLQKNEFIISDELLDIFGCDKVQYNGDFCELINKTVVLDEQKKVMELFCAPSGSEDLNEIEFKISIGNEIQHVWAEARYSYSPDNTLIGVSGIVQDVTRRKEMEEKLLHLAHYDELTGLANRVLFYDRIKQAVGLSKRERRIFALLYLDFDGFKVVNDNYGHDIGDKLLKTLAVRIKACLRDSDTVARLGGDEFAIILPTISKVNDSITASEKILSEVQKPVPLRDTDFSLTVSIGISVYPQDAQEIGALIKNADIAMYYAKESGKNQYKLFSYVKEN